MSLKADYQRLEPGSTVTLIEVDCTAFDGGVLYFHSVELPYTPEEILAAGGDANKLPGKPIYWQGRKYSPWPADVSGLEKSSEGSSPRPKLSVANLDQSISTLCMVYNDLLQAKVIVHHTLAHFLDAKNFPTGNPTADPTAESIDVWYIDTKTSDNDISVEWTLASPADVQGQKLPTRQMTSRCTWCMRGEYRTANCGYTGSKYFDKYGNPVNNPALDECGGTVKACQLRWGEDAELPFGGFPAISLVRR
ncbi:phage minor tail protein L [Serratia fonticola]|uniref:phage minor tail protein L n=1 Tax=Serratia fonticola TaxID=47917 RepID=UPI0015C64A16|nr:phage minor tail protein L [Serratia fonticola]NYA15767.1 phage minor tail protein L [Serratia fonticola]NYA35887.1 phage minor tail protein L [Serratia fonticola]